MNCLLVCFGILAIGLSCASGVTAVPTIKRINGPSDSGVEARTGNGGSYAPRVSHDGRWVVFASSATDLVSPPLLRRRLNVFVHDRTSGLVSLVSSNIHGVSVDGDSSAPDISADGRLVVFASTASNLVENDTNQVSDIFLKDLVAGSLHRISTGADGRQANGASMAPQLSPDGRHVCFGSYASNLVDGAVDADGRLDVFVRDLVLGRTEQISPTVQPARDLDISEYVMSSDSRWVAFISGARGVLDATFTPLSTSVYVHDRSTGVTRFIEGLENLPSPNIPREANSLVFAAARPRLAFVTRCSTNNVGVTNTVQVVDMEDQGYRTVLEAIRAGGSRGDRVTAPSFSGDAKTLVYAQDGPGDSGPVAWVWREGESPAVLTQSSGAPSLPVRELALSSRGDQLVATYATDVPSADIHAPPVLSLGLFDIEGTELRRLRRVSGPQALTGLEGVAPIFAAGTNRVVFQAETSRLVRGDRNFDSDIFAFRSDSDPVEVTLISRASQSQQPRSAILGAKYVHGVSLDGRRIVFTSLDRGNVESGVDAEMGLYLHDSESGVTRRIPTPNGLSVPTPPSFISAPPAFSWVALSGNGRFVAFAAPMKFKNSQDVRITRAQLYLHDTALDQTVRVNTDMNGRPREFRDIQKLKISADGRFLAFFGKDSLSTGSAEGRLYAHDRQSGITYRLRYIPNVESPLESYQMSGLGGRLVSTSAVNSPYAVLLMDLVADFVEEIDRDRNTGAAISFDGSRVSIARLLLPNEPPIVYLRENDEAPWTEVMGRFPLGLDSRFLGMSHDGRHLALGIDRLRRIGSHPQWMEQGITIIDLGTGNPWPVLVRSDGTAAAPGMSRSLRMSADGSLIAFQSQDNNLVSGDSDDLDDVFLRERGTGETRRVETRFPKESAMDRIMNPWLSMDGSRLVVTSWSPFLAKEDDNPDSDVFLIDQRRPPLGDLDGDLMDDGWEVLWFGNTSGGGARDYDGDGFTDAHEFVLGTCPIDDMSGFRIVARRTGDLWILEWKTVGGRRYELLQSKTPVGSPYLPVEVVQGTGMIATITVPITDDFAFFRVRASMAP